MNLFNRENGKLKCEKVSLSDLAEKYQTPLYVYSKGTIDHHCREFKAAFHGYPTLPCYAVKANSTLGVIRTIAAHGFGADIVSLGELERALKAGVKPNEIIFSGVGKKEEEINRALEVGILSLHVESESELTAIEKVARARQQKASVSFRINPNIEVKTHPHISTGLYCTKFGVTEERFHELLRRVKNSGFLKLDGIGCHIGSQILDLEPFRKAAKRMAEIATAVKKDFPLEFIDMGGGFGIPYHNENPPPLCDYARTLLEAIKPTGLKLLLEPGRVLVANAGVLLTKVIHLKETPEKKFIVIDAAMNDLIRPSLYEAFHQIEPVATKTGKSITADVVGPICESGDLLGLERTFSEPAPGDLFAIRSAGAYGMSMSSNYNTRPRVAEVLVDGEKVQVIRQRETLEQLWANES